MELTRRPERLHSLSLKCLLSPPFSLTEATIDCIKHSSGRLEINEAYWLRTSCTAAFFSFPIHFFTTFAGHLNWQIITRFGYHLPPHYFKRRRFRKHLKWNVARRPKNFALYCQASLSFISLFRPKKRALTRTLAHIDDLSLHLEILRRFKGDIDWSEIEYDKYAAIADEFYREFKAYIPCLKKYARYLSSELVLELWRAKTFTVHELYDLIKLRSVSEELLQCLVDATTEKCPSSCTVCGGASRRYASLTGSCKSLLVRWWDQLEFHAQQKLSPEFIHRNFSRLNAKFVGRQKLSVEFMLEKRHRLCWPDIIAHHKLDGLLFSLCTDATKASKSLVKFLKKEFEPAVYAAITQAAETAETLEVMQRLRGTIDAMDWKFFKLPGQFPIFEYTWTSPADFFLVNASRLDWYRISVIRHFSAASLISLSHLICWPRFPPSHITGHVPVEFFRLLKDSLDWNELQKFEKDLLLPEFFGQYIPARKYSQLTVEEFYARFGKDSDDEYIRKIGYFADMPDEFIRSKAHLLNWQQISKRSKLSTSLHVEYFNKINWTRYLKRNLLY